MTQPIPTNLAALARQEALSEANQAIGQQVMTEDDIMASSQDAFNSMAAARAQSRYDRFRSLDSRRPESVKEGQYVGDIKRVEGAGEKKREEEDLAQSYSRKNPELPANKLRDLKTAVNKEGVSEKEIYDAVNRAFEDPTLADEALNYLEESTTGPLKETISRVRQLLNQEKEREIVAGKNINEIATDFAGRGYGASPTALRDLYREVTGTERDHNSLFNMLAQQYPYEQLKEIVAFLLKGMAYDMKSKGPSIPPELLMVLMKEVKDLQSVLWVYLFFKERMKLMRNLYGRFGMTYPEQVTFENLAKSFMKLVNDRYPSMAKIIREAERLGVVEDLEKVIVISQYRDAVRGLSPRLYYSIKHKQDLLLAVIQALEELEEEEEEEEGT